MKQISMPAGLIFIICLTALVCTLALVPRRSFSPAIGMDREIVSLSR
ncbi:hypothetical protein [Xaviernesmea oryzae]|nr:hypothetical protein [Xaviernesmea oryzae]SEK46140.1 hypothetical protein SAMN04487976_102237 [Xaviernesmea oryzae]